MRSETRATTEEEKCLVNCRYGGNRLFLACDVCVEIRKELAALRVEKGNLWGHYRDASKTHGILFRDMRSRALAAESSLRSAEEALEKIRILNPDWPGQIAEAKRIAREALARGSKT